MKALTEVNITDIDPTSNYILLTLPYSPMEEEEPEVSRVPVRK
jgi:hypothetical protein